MGNAKEKLTKESIEISKNISKEHSKSNSTTKNFKYILLIVAPFLFFVLTVSVGRFYVSPSDVCRSIFTFFTGVDTGVSLSEYTIVTEIRMIRALQGLLVGASLAASGACFQSIFKNPLVSSGMLGVSSGAGFGAALSIVILGTSLFTGFFSFGFGVLAVILSYLVGKICGNGSAITLVLGGTIIQSIFQALLSLLKFTADTTDQLPAITFWLMGSLSSTKNSDFVLACIPMIVGLLGIFIFKGRLNILSMGDREAQTLGIDVKFNKLVIIAFATLATAGAVSISGIVGWIGLVVPHICRMIFGNNNKILIPASISVGACFCVATDTICRTISGNEIPLGIVTAIVGGPFFIYLLKKTKGKQW